MEKKPINKKKYLVGGIIALVVGVVLIFIEDSGVIKNAGRVLLSALGCGCTGGGAAAIFMALKKDKPTGQDR